MKDVAALLIVLAFLVGFITMVVFVFSDAEWYYGRSPRSGICYEIRKDVFLFGYSKSISPVDDKYCED